MHPSAVQPAPHSSSPSLPLTLKRLLPAADGPAQGEGEGGASLQRDRQFTGMLQAFRETGGVMRGDEAAALMQVRGTGSLSLLARWIVAREVLSFEWQGELWVPLFQFNLADMSLRPEVARISGEWSSAFDGWTLACWFATPHEHLGQRLPADVLAEDAGAVLQAARADRLGVIDEVSLDRLAEPLPG